MSSALIKTMTTSHLNINFQYFNRQTSWINMQGKKINKISVNCTHEGS